MNGNIVGNGKNLLKIVVDGNAVLEGDALRQIRVVTDNRHTKVNGSLCHQSADSTEADNNQGLALYLRAGKGGLALFYRLAHIVALVLDGLAPVNGLCYLAGGQ